MKISVITAVFNRKNTISRSILSTKNQVFKNIELIIIDGGSTDGTIEIVASLIEKGDVFVSEKDFGIYDALNKGIQLATGDIICFLHSDDYYENNDVLNEISNYFDKFHFDIVYGNATFFRQSAPNFVIRKYLSPNFTKRNLSYGLMPAHPSMFVKKSVYKKHGLFNEIYKIAGDFEWLCRVSNDESIKTLKIEQNFVRMQFGGASTNGVKSLLVLNLEVANALRSNGIKSSYFRLIFKYFKKIFEFRFFK